MSRRARVLNRAPAAPHRDLVLATGALLVVAQLGFRAWQLYPSWFYTDDYRLLDDATGTSCDWSYLALPFDSQFMPFGRGVACLVAASGHVNWALAATLTLALQLLAGAAALWMLVTLFGARWGVLAPLAIYLSSAIPTPATMWWAASLNQLPLQAVLFAAVAAWVRYLRTRRLRWLGLTLAVVALGLLCYVKTLLVLGVLAYLLLGYFTAGSLRSRLVRAVRTYWPAAVGAGVVGGAFLAYYVEQVPSVLQPGGRPVAGQLLDTMVGTAFASGAVGGPWRWNTSNPPTAYADPPAWAVHLSWVLIVLVVLIVALRRRRTLRAWMLLAGYLAAAYFLVLSSRAPIAGAGIGLEYRYLTDVVALLGLCLGLATMELRGAVESSQPRELPLLLLAPGPRTVAAATTLVCASSMLSSALYARVWHDDNPGDDYMHAAMSGLSGKGEHDLADQVVPHAVVPGFSAPYNTTGRLLPLLVDNASFPEATPQLVVLDDAGTPWLAGIDAAVTGRKGPVPGCGWRIRRSMTTIPLDGSAFDFGWWIRIGYLASTDDTMTVRMPGIEEEVDVQRGLNSVFVHVDGGFRSITLGGLREPDSTVCVDTVEVGQPVPEGAL